MAKVTVPPLNNLLDYSPAGPLTPFTTAPLSNMVALFRKLKNPNDCVLFKQIKHVSCVV
jgi:hypothetical protein